MGNSVFSAASSKFRGMARKSVRRRMLLALVIVVFFGALTLLITATDW